MKSLTTIALIFIFCVQGFTQSERFVVYDLTLSQVVDTTAAISFDNNVIQSTTGFHFGELYSWTPMSNDFPSEQFLYETSLFSHRIAAGKFFNLEDFPLRATPKLMQMVDGDLGHYCSSTMIGEAYILTAAHCLYSNPLGWILPDSIFVFPSFNGGQPNINLPSTMVEKVYVPLSYINQENFLNDIAICKLAEPIGLQTGWLSIGYHLESSFFENKVFHKSAFPAFTVAGPPVNPDTMYYAFGQAEIQDSMRLIIPNYIGAPGESGSSLYYTNNVNTYTAYGVASTAQNFSHIRIMPSVYYPIVEIIQAEVTTSTEDLAVDENRITVFPNPTSTFFEIQNSKVNFPAKYEIFSTQMKLVRHGIIADEHDMINVQNLPGGIYLLVVNDHKIQHQTKFIKK
ncbi:MAG: T9SS type A sorting domain-containing protein [Bacteroidota bacterium]